MSDYIKRYSAGLLSCLLLAACQQGDDKLPEQQAQVKKPSNSNLIAMIEIANPSAFSRVDEPMQFSLDELGLVEGDQRASQLLARIDKTSLPTQVIDQDANGRADHLLFLSTLQPHEKQMISIVLNTDTTHRVASVKRTQAEVSHKVDGQWQPREQKPQLQEYVGGEFSNVRHLQAPPQHTDHSNYIRYEGPGIESDKVAYRIYLDWRNGFDIFGKKTSDMVLQTIGQDGFESYHHMADWGMDILKVGNSLGAGGYGYWDGKAVQRVSKVEQISTDILENGDSYSSLNIHYKGWSIADKKLDLSANLSMTAGSRLVHTQVSLSDQLPNLAIGLVKHPGTTLLEGDINITGRAWTYVASYGKQSLNDDELGMAVIFQKGTRIEQQQDEHSYVSVMKTAGNKLDYYFLAAWEGELNGISSQEEFVAYLKQEVERLTLKPRVRLKAAHSEEEKQFPITAKSALRWSERLADSELNRKTLKYALGGYDEIRQRKPRFEYTTGLLMQAYDDYSHFSPNAKYNAAIEKVLGSFIADNGDIRLYELEKYNIDSINSGKMLLRLYKKTGKEKYKIAAGHLRRQLENHPRTREGAFWHKKKYPHQLWLDGVYMGMPFLAAYSKMFEEGAGFDEVVNEFKISRTRLRDPATGLYFHAWDEKKQQDWADPETGLSKYHWARGMGWLAMALVDVLEIIPSEKTQLREPLLNMLSEVAKTLVAYQDPETGVWWQIMDMPEKAGNYLESSASSMFVYALAKGINLGYLPGHYKEHVTRAYEGIIREFISVNASGQISLTNMCLVAGLGFGRDGSYFYYMSEPVYKDDPKGTAPFIMAGVQLSQLLSSTQ